MEGLLDMPLNTHKLLKEQFVSNLTGSPLLEIAALSTVVPACGRSEEVELWSSDFHKLPNPIMYVNDVLSNLPWNKAKLTQLVAPVTNSAFLI
ncbi:hypothetical protein GUJ93_ZPchr0013g37306 [Zizania palustris]|uniref:Uncharacterized protein n=1 Tax=Zizania palustris TaxID=103762 RepID=A0A8J6C213_ZIZPA|nr:hypothetical protein GUJ93_ZPchr0013g37306 [Zizania palustris]